MKDDPLQLDYEQTNELIRMLTDIRFKLLAAVPAASAAVVVLVVEKPDHTAALVVGFLGFIITFAITLYELRNTHLYNAAIHRAKGLEDKGLPRLSDGAGGAGLFSERPAHASRLFGVQVWHDRSLAIVYAAAIGGWIYLIAPSALALSNVRTLFALLPAAIGFLIFQNEFLKVSDSAKPRPAGSATTAAVPSI